MDLSGKAIGKGILEAFAVVGAVVAVLAGLFISLYVVTIVLGALFNLTSTTLPISTAAATYLTNISTAFFTVANSLLSAVTFAGTLMPIAIVLLVFAGAGFGVYAGYKKYKKSKGGGDMGY